jgi:hypothetical protein
LKGEVRDGQQVLVDFDAAKGQLTFTASGEARQQGGIGIKVAFTNATRRAATWV